MTLAGTWCCVQPEEVGITQPMELPMQFKFLGLTMLLATLALPMAAQAQGTVRGAQEGAREGDRNAGPVGAVVGGTIGAVTGTIGGILGVEDRPRFREYVIHERHLPIAMTMTSASAPCCRKAASSITTCRPITTSAATATPM
jgi:hypothetical protein